MATAKKPTTAKPRKRRPNGKPKGVNPTHSATRGPILPIGRRPPVGSIPEAVDKQVGWQFDTMIMHNPCKGDVTYTTPEMLWEQCCAYVEWCMTTCIKEEKLIVVDKEVVREEIHHPRAMTNYGLCLFLGISERTWRDWRSDPKHKFAEVLISTEHAMRQYKIEGAAVGLFNANIISRELGLRDEQSIASPPVNLNVTIDVSSLSTEALKELDQAKVIDHDPIDR